MKTMKILSLFSGCGGMDLGFEGDFETMAAFMNTHLTSDWIKERRGNKVLLKPTGFKVVFANDILREAAAAYIPFFTQRGHRQEWFHKESIVELVKKHKAGDFCFPTNIDIVTGGFPCQDFSVAGKRLGFKSHKSHKGENACEFDIINAENRGKLYIWMREVIQITKPKVFFAENVKGLVSLGDVKEIIENDFRSIDNEGYLIVPAQVLNAADYGVPQNRERVIFIGFNKRFMRKEAIEALSKREIPTEYNPYPKKTHYNPQKPLLNDSDDNSLIPYSTCRQAFDGLKEPEEETKDLAQKAYSKAKFLKGKQGNSEIKLDSIAPTIRAEHHGNIEYRRLSFEHGGKYVDELKTMKERRLTVRECARIQTFPDNYEFIRKGPRNDPFNISASGAYRIIGNAVPPLLAYHLAQRIKSIWDKIFIGDNH